MIKLLNSYCTELYKGTCDSLYSGWAATPGRGVFNRASARECSPKFPLSATQILAKARSVEIASVWWFVSQLVVKNLNGISNFTWQMRLIFSFIFNMPPEQVLQHVCFMIKHLYLKFFVSIFLLGCFKKGRNEMHPGSCK